MTPAEFRALRKGLGLTQVQTAAALGLDPMTISRYETGGIAITAPIARLARIYAHFPEVLRWIEAEATPAGPPV